MSIDLSQFTTTDSGIYVPHARSRVNTIPWDDLQALDPPDSYQSVNQDLQATLANMVGQTLTGPKLIRSNFAGAVRSDSNINPTSIVTVGTGVGGKVITVDDASQFAESAQCFVSSGFSNPTSYGFISGITLIDFVKRQITLQVAAPNAIQVGDIVQSMPITFVIPQAGFWGKEVLQVQPFQNGWFNRTFFNSGTPTLTSLVGPQNTQTLEYFEVCIRCPVGTSYNGQVVLSNTGNQIYETELACEGPNPAVGVDCAPGGGPSHSANVLFIGGSTASLTIPAGGAGVHTVLDSFTFSILNTTAAAQLAVAKVWLGASGATLAWNDPIGCVAGDSKTVHIPNYKLYNPTANQVLTLEFDRNAAGFYEAISATYHYTLATQPMSMARVWVSGLNLANVAGATWTLALSNPIPSGSEVGLSIGGNDRA